MAVAIHIEIDRNQHVSPSVRTLIRSFYSFVLCVAHFHIIHIDHLSLAQLK